VLHKNRISTATSQLYVSLNTARSEALKRRNAVMVCPSSNSSACRNDGDWSEGWIIFDNADDNGTPASAEIIRLVDTVHGQVDMQVENTMDAYVEFLPTGAAVGDSGNTGQFRICHSNSSSFSKAVNVSATGRVDTVDRTETNCAASS
jgi:type IV fimbrial biogenesis protein FimT